MQQERYFTKSLYKLALECPTKLFYTCKREEYADSKMDDPFMEALAEGGYQVGELAKKYFPAGHDLSSLNTNDAETQTNELLRNDKVTIFEGVIHHENLLIRIDVLVKDGSNLELIEVKAKSMDSKGGSPFFGSKGGLDTKWKPYLYDIAFQNHALSSKFPSASISNYLMLADKNVKCATNGLNQKFRVSRDENSRKGVIVHSSLSGEDLKHPVLIQVSVDDAVAYIQERNTVYGRSFGEDIHYLASAYESNQKIKPIIGRHCKGCEFKVTNKIDSADLRSGFKECWAEYLGWTDKDFKKDNILDIWNLHYKTRDKLFDKGKILLTDILEDDLNIRDSDKPGLSQSERQWLQIEKSQNNDMSTYFDMAGFREEMSSWTYPLHFIDFETTMVALPFTQGRKPYEGIAFQFSHHSYFEDGRIEHTGEYINTERGVFPNIDFIRELKSQLENDEGTIFRYADHENNFLNLIKRQLEDMPDQVDDSEELINFICSITHSPEKTNTTWVGERDMIDMLELVKRFYYNPVMKGSNSLKVVLPAILDSSIFLQEKYSKPIYGSVDGISSRNFPSGWKWVEMDGFTVKDPYKKLPKLFKDISDYNMERLSNDDEIANGGAAMTAYAKMQFEEISGQERSELRDALLRYCELDTFAMVMLFEGWKTWDK